jgi:hypothetical protein
MSDRKGDIGSARCPRIGFRQAGTSTVLAERRERDIVGIIDLLRNASALIIAMLIAAFSSRLLRIGPAVFAKGAV